MAVGAAQADGGHAVRGGAGAGVQTDLLAIEICKAVAGADDAVTAVAGADVQ